MRKSNATLKLFVKSHMYFKVVEKFGPSDGARWSDYLTWRGLNLTRFDSVDGILRCDLFNPKSEDDWKNCLHEDCKISLITNLEYARKIQKQHLNSEIVGIEFPVDAHYQANTGLLGFDVIDSYCDVSLLTNWGTDADGIFSDLIMENGLLGNLKQALRIRDTLRKRFPEDDHACECHVCAIYKVGT